MSQEEEFLDDVAGNDPEAQAKATMSLRARLEALAALEKDNPKYADRKSVAILDEFARRITGVGDSDAVMLWGILLQAAIGKGAQSFVSKMQTEDRKARKIAKRTRWSKAREDRFTNLTFTSDDDLVEALNEVTALVRRGNKRLFLYFDKKDQKYIFLGERDARLEFAPYLLSLPDENHNICEPFEGLPRWVRSPDRREYARVVFNPRTTHADPDELNMFMGFEMEEKQGDWSLFRDHIKDIICGGNEEHFRFLMAWLAMLVQEPWRKNGIVIVLRGVQGAGKTILAEMLGKMLGMRYCMITGQGDTWTGRFNSQLEQIILLGADESFFAGDKASRGKFKHLATSLEFTYERKGEEVYTGKNFTHIIVTSNEDWVVPADIGDRRMFVLDVLPDHAPDYAPDDESYFGPIYRQMEKEGGLAAMMYELLRYDYSAVDFSMPPRTDALAEQIERGFPPEKKWLVSCLREGRLSFRDDALHRVDEFGEGEVYIAKSDVFASFRESVSGYRDQWNDGEIGAFLHAQIPDIAQARPRNGRERLAVYVFPPLAVMREAFLKANPGFQWGEDMPEVVVEEDTATDGDPVADNVEVMAEHKAKRHKSHL